MEIECRFIASSYSYKCKVTKASITKPNVDVVSFKGKHQPGKSNDDVTGVIFDNARVKYFPRNLQRIFPHIDTLIIENCGLKEISREDLIGLEKLEWLNLNYNQLKSLPDDLFRNMPSLKTVWLSNNKIEFASSKLIEPIVGNQLDYFDLSDNASINEYYSRDFEGGCRTIQELMTKIDEKCKPPIPQPISRSAKCGSFSDAAERKFLKGFNEFRLLGLFTDFIIVVGSKYISGAQKYFVAAKPGNRAKMFEVKKNVNKLEILYMSAEAVEASLDYLNERKLPGAYLHSSISFDRFI